MSSYDDTVNVNNSRASWPHAPLHELSEHGTYFVTAATCDKENIFRGAERLRYLHDTLLTVARDLNWELEAWAVFSNHYHFVAHAPPGSQSGETLRELIRLVHGRTAVWANRRDGLSHRRVWHNYWDVRLTYQKSYYARLCYTHQNPVKHGLVRLASHYPWCSAQWFETTAQPAQVRTIYGFKIDRLHVVDDFDVAPDW